jgi:hypothetical protein
LNLDENRIETVYLLGHHGINEINLGGRSAGDLGLNRFLDVGQLLNRRQYLGLLSLSKIWSASADRYQVTL